MRFTAFLLAMLTLAPIAKAQQVERPLVVVGDSLSCGSFGKRLVQQLGKSRKLRMYCTVSSAAIHWVEGKNPGGQTCYSFTSDDLNENLSFKKPEAAYKCRGTGKVPTFASIIENNPGADFIVGLGTNSLSSSAASSHYRVMAQAVQNARRACIWIGPPNLRPDQENPRIFRRGSIAQMQGRLEDFYESLASRVQGCDLHDSRKHTLAGTFGNVTTDGVHRGPKGGTAWADSMLPSLIENLAEFGP